jgi:hypothetical protein
MMIRIVSRLWSIIWDLLLYINGSRNKSLEEIYSEIDVAEYLCRGMDE